jgi:RNA polymerase sigma-70 factor, ECF subfamily
MSVDQSTDAVSDMSLDEWALVGRVAAGDRGALESLYRNYHHRLGGFLWRSIGSRNGTSEVLDDTFLEVWRGAKHFRKASLVVSIWIIRITYRKALEYLCQQQGFSLRSNAQCPPQQSINASSDTKAGAALQQGLFQMPFEHRSTLVLAYYLGCALEEIAAITGVPIAIVKIRMLQARETLRWYIPTAAMGPGAPEVPVTPGQGDTED